jgi:hypothetical protein
MTMKILRFDTVILNGNSPLGEKSKAAIRMADNFSSNRNTGEVNEHNRITGINYTSQDARTAETITFQQYHQMQRPEYIARVADGSLNAVPQVLVPADFPPRQFD